MKKEDHMPKGFHHSQLGKLRTSIKNDAKSKALKEAIERPMSKKHTKRGEISHPWQVKSKDNK